MKDSKILTNQKDNKLPKSVNLYLHTISDLKQSQKQQKSKDKYYLQISPHFQTHTLTFTNQIKKLKSIQYEEMDTEESLKKVNHKKLTDHKNFILRNQKVNFT